ncbi:hypothetical protein P8452_54749 [Trifolium repens]|nr:hypothetical protein P8452_54749 [Trifolium repens]
MSWMSPTNNILSHFRTSTVTSSLVPLDVPHSNSHELSSISKYLPSLRSLWVQCSSEVQLSHDATIILDALYATYSEELEPTATTSQVSRNSLKSLFIQIVMNCQVANILKEQILQNLTVDESGGCVLPNDSYPNWLSFDCEGSSVIFEVPQVEGHNLKSLMCITCTSTPDNITSDGLKNVLVKNYTKATIQLYNNETLASFEDEEGQRVVSSIEPGNKVEIIVVFGNGFIVKKTSVYLIYEQLDTQEELATVSDGDENECSVRGSSPQVELVDEKDIVFSGDDNEGIVRTSSQQVELVDENGGADSCCGLIKYSFRHWITDFLCRLVQCWGLSSWT